MPVGKTMVETIMRPISKFCSSLLLSFAILGGPAMAQTSGPSKSIRLIVPFGAGGPVDASARALGKELGEVLKTPVIIENKPGAGSIIGASACKAAVPDGQTFCVFLSDTITINPALYSKLPYDAQRDFLPVASLVRIESAIVVGGDLPIADMKQLQKYDGTRPNALNWGSFGVGSSGHLYLGQVNKGLSTQIHHVPYSQGGAAVVTGLISGDIQVSMLSYGLVNQWVQKGALKAIAVMGDTPSPFFPGVPTARSQGLRLNTPSWIGLYAPSGTPSAVVESMNETVGRILQDPAFQQQYLEPQGLRPMVSTIRQLDERLRRERGEWAATVKELDMQLD